MRDVFGLDALFARKGDAAPAVQAAIPPTRPNRFEALARTLGYGTFRQEADMDQPPPTKVDPDHVQVTPFRRPVPAAAVTRADEPLARVAVAGAVVDATTPDSNADSALVAQHRPRPPGWGQQGTARPMGGSASRSPTAIPTDPTENNRLGSAWARRRTPPQAQMQTPPHGDAAAPDTEGTQSPQTEAAAPPEASPVLSADMIRRAPRRPADSGRPWQRVRDALGGTPAQGDAASIPAMEPQAGDPAPRPPLGAAPDTNDIPASPVAKAPTPPAASVSAAAPPTATADTQEDGEHLDISLFSTGSAPRVDREMAPSGTAPQIIGETPRRRHVSVRLPDREHGLLRQFAHLCGTTQQDVVRRALLTYMMGELQRRLDAAPPPPSEATPRDWARFSHGLAPATDRDGR